MAEHELPRGPVDVPHLRADPVGGGDMVGHIMDLGHMARGVPVPANLFLKKGSACEILKVVWFFFLCGCSPFVIRIYHNFSQDGFCEEPTPRTSRGQTGGPHDSRCLHGPRETVQTLSCLTSPSIGSCDVTSRPKERRVVTGGDKLTRTEGVTTSQW